MYFINNSFLDPGDLVTLKEDAKSISSLVIQHPIPKYQQINKFVIFIVSKLCRIVLPF